MTTTWTVRLLHYASQDVPGAQVRLQAGFDAWERFDYHVLLLESGDRRVLVDCGMDDLDPFNGFLRGTVGERGLVRATVPDRPVEALLARHGVRPDDVEAIVLTHAHADHVWNVDRFPRARVLVSAQALARLEDVAARLPQLVPDPLYPAHALRFLRAERGRRVQACEDGPTPLDGIAIRYLGGHAVDSAGVVIATGDGPVVHPGDTVWTYRNLDDDHPVGALEDVSRCLEAMAWTRAQGGTFLPSHDPRVHERYPDGVVAWG